MGLSQALKIEKTTLGIAVQGPLVCYKQELLTSPLKCGNLYRILENLRLSKSTLYAYVHSTNLQRKSYVRKCGLPQLTKGYDSHLGRLAKPGSRCECVDYLAYMYATS